jgi:hypothetical protein
MTQQALMKEGLEGMYLNIINTIYDKPIANVVLNRGKNEAISSKVKNETRVSTLN